MSRREPPTRTRGVEEAFPRPLVGSIAWLGGTRRRREESAGSRLGLPSPVERHAHFERLILREERPDDLLKLR